MTYKFNDGDKVRVVSGKYKGVEGVILWREESVPPPAMYFIKITNTAGTTYNLDFTDSFGEEYLALVEPDVREVGKKIKPELVRIGDKIRAVYTQKNGLEESRGAVVAKIVQGTCNGKPTFYNEQDMYIGYAFTEFHFVLDEESTIHELTLAPVGTKFKAVRGPGSCHYLIYTKYREGWWVCESYEKGTDVLVEINMRSERTTINEFDKGRSEYIAD